MKNLGKIGLLFVVGVLILSGCGKTAGDSDLDNFLEARIEQYCYGASYEGDTDYDDLTEEQKAEFEQGNIDILNKHGFEGNVIEDFEPLVKEMERAVKESGKEKEFEDKYFDEILKRGCATQEEVDFMRNPPEVVSPGDIEFVEKEEGAIPAFSESENLDVDGVYTNLRFGVKFEMPENWGIIDEGAGIVRIGDPEGKGEIWFNYSDENPKQLEIWEWAAELWPDWDLEEKFTEIEVGGYPALDGPEFGTVVVLIEDVSMRIQRMKNGEEGGVDDQIFEELIPTVEIFERSE